MDRGAPQLSIVVIPGSGTGARAGLRGTMGIVITDGTHEHELEGSLP